jgi:hypothetical protein
MKGHSFGNPFGTYITLGLVALIVISSPVVMTVNPTLAKSSSSPTSDNGNTLAPSTIGQDGDDFTIQAPLSSVTARPTNNIVTTTSFYDIVFLTATAGAIKTIEVTFPAGTQMAATPLLNEVEGIGPGTPSRSGQTIIYTVANAVNVPAGTKIRLEIANINNPVNPSTSYTVMVTTKNAANTPIDGPTASTAYTIKQLGSSIIAPNSITTTRIADGAVTTPKIADFAVTSSKLGTFSVTGPKLDTGSVSTSKIEEGAVTTPKIADGAVTNSKLGFQSVTSDKIAPGSLSIPSTQRLGNLVNVPAGMIATSTASCFSGGPEEELVGGGHGVTATFAADVRHIDSLEAADNVWQVRVFNAGSGAMTVQATALCIPDFIP